MTLQERLIRFLTTPLKMTEAESNSKKYRKVIGHYVTLWVGKNGSVRSGVSYGESHSITDQVQGNMKQWETKTSQPI